MSISKIRRTSTPHRTATALYAPRLKEARGLLSEIGKALSAHSEKQKHHETDYGYPGDLAHVIEQLKHVKRFLGK